MKLNKTNLPTTTQKPEKSLAFFISPSTQKQIKMKTLRIIKNQDPHKSTNSEISKKIKSFLKQPSKKPSLKKLKQRKSLLRYLRTRLTNSYFKWLCRFRSNLLDTVKIETPVISYYHRTNSSSRKASGKRYPVCTSIRTKTRTYSYATTLNLSKDEYNRSQRPHASGEDEKNAIKITTEYKRMKHILDLMK